MGPNTSREVTDFLGQLNGNNAIRSQSQRRFLKPVRVKIERTMTEKRRFWSALSPSQVKQKILELYHGDTFDNFKKCYEKSNESFFIRFKGEIEKKIKEIVHNLFYKIYRSNRIVQAVSQPVVQQERDEFSSDKSEDRQRVYTSEDELDLEEFVTNEEKKIKKEKGRKKKIDDTEEEDEDEIENEEKKKRINRALIFELERRKEKKKKKKKPKPENKKDEEDEVLSEISDFKPEERKKDSKKKRKKKKSQFSDKEDESILSELSDFEEDKKVDDADKRMFTDNLFHERTVVQLKKVARKYGIKYAGLQKKDLWKKIGNAVGVDVLEIPLKRVRRTKKKKRKRQDEGKRKTKRRRR